MFVVKCPYCAAGVKQLQDIVWQHVCPLDTLLSFSNLLTRVQSEVLS